jgi:ribosome-associated protein
MQEIKIETEFIKLDQLLKLVDVASTGGHAKYLIQEGYIKINGSIEYQRGKKIKPGDILEAEGKKIKVL